MSDLRKLAQFIHDITWDQLPERVRETAALRVLDLVSGAAGAAKDPLVAAAKQAMGAVSGCPVEMPCDNSDACFPDTALERRLPGSGQAAENTAQQGFVSVWGDSRKYPLATAAMLNAMLAHTLELDDVHTASKTHGSASLIPAAWSCAEYLGKSGKEFLLAVICGYETVNRVGMAFGVSAHRNRGWHATATCGVFGCAAACAKLLDLSVDQIVSALGMAGTQSSGVWAFLGDGSNCKILHPARAAADGIEAAFLAKAGMTGPEHIFDAKDGGLLFAMSDGGDVSKLSQGLGEVYEILNMDMKPYPCCRSAHCAIDAVLDIRRQMEAHMGLTIQTEGEAEILAGQIQKGDIIVAGKNFGCGSSREQAPEIIKALGIQCVIAKSFARIFFRNSINNGLLLIEQPDLHDDIKEGDEVTVVMNEHVDYNGKQYPIASLPENLMSIIQAGGLVKAMRKLNGLD